MATSSRPDRCRWYFSKEKLLNTPTIRCGVDPEKELSYRQQAANLIQDMGQRLQVFQLCINTAMVYMHRFYMFHSFTKFPRNSIAAASLFLAAKVEEQPHKLEHVLRVAHACLHRGEPPLDPRSNTYAQQAQELVINESIILQTLGFEVGVVHPHSHVVKCTQMIRASKDLSQSSYFLATNSLHLTTFCLKYKPTVVACVCIHIACKWTQWTIPKSNDGKGWWEYVDHSVTKDVLDDLTREFLSIIDRSNQTRLNKRLMGYRGKHGKLEGHSRTDSGQPSQASGSSQGDNSAGASTSSAPYDISMEANKPASGFDNYSDGEDSDKGEKASKEKTTAAPTPVKDQPQEQPRKVSFEDYKRKERDRKEKEMQTKKQEVSQGPSDRGDKSSLLLGRPSLKDSRHKIPSGVDKHLSSSDKKLPHIHEKLPSGLEKVPSSQERLHTGHDRIPGHERIPAHDKHAAGHEKHPPRPGRTSQGQEKISSGHTRGPSGPERLHSSEEKGSSGSLKVGSSREHSGVSRPSGEKGAPGHGMKSQDRPHGPHSSASDGKHSTLKEHARPEKTTTPLSGKDPPSTKSERTLPSGSDSTKREGESCSHSQSTKGGERSEKHPHPHHSSKVSKPTQPHRTAESQVPKIPQLLVSQEVKKEPESEKVSQETLEMFQQYLREEVIKDLEDDKTLTVPSSDAAVSVKTEVLQPPRQKVVHPVEVASPFVKDSKPPGKFDLPTDEQELERKRAELLSQLSAISDDSGEVEASAAPSKQIQDIKREKEREHSDNRKEREKRRDHHKHKKDDKKHRSHKQRHQSPSTFQKLPHENDVGEGSGDMVPAKKQKVEHQGSPHTVLTTSQGIKLKIKGLSNSFNNGSEYGNAAKEPNTSSDSPGLSLKLNLREINSSHEDSQRESSKERDGSSNHHHHHRSHHKHKSRHHRSKDGHRKRPRSPGMSSASDASPAMSPSKRRTQDASQVSRSTLPSSQSLLNLPMPPQIKRSSHHTSSSSKTSKHKHEYRPPLPSQDASPSPPPPPPPPSQAMPLSTIDMSALMDFHPPLPSHKPINDRPPPPPPISGQQRRPPLPP